MDSIIRKATSDDLDRLLYNRIDFITGFFGQQPSEQFREVTREYLAKHIADGTMLCYLALSGDQIVSSAIACFYNVLPKINNLSGKTGYIFNVFTIPEYRGLGLATRVLQAMIHEAKALGIEELYLSASESGKPLYEKLKFQLLDAEMRLKMGEYNL